MMMFQFIFLQIIVFSAVIFFMKRILSNDTRAAVGRLDSVYQDLLAKQKELNEKIEEAEKEYEAKKEEAMKITEEYKSEANDEMHKKKEEVLKAAKQQADEMLERAKSSCDEIRAQLQRDVEAKAIDTASAVLQKALKQKTLAAFHDLVFDDFLENAKNFDLSKVSGHIDTVTVRTPFPLTEQHKNKISAFISGKIDRILKIEEIIDPLVIAGVALQFGSLLVDGSLANTINDVAEDLKEKVRLGD